MGPSPLPRLDCDACRSFGCDLGERKRPTRIVPSQFFRPTNAASPWNILSKPGRHGMSPHERSARWAKDCHPANAHGRPRTAQQFQMPTARFAGAQQRKSAGKASEEVFLKKADNADRKKPGDRARTGPSERSGVFGNEKSRKRRVREPEQDANKNSRHDAVHRVPRTASGAERTR